MRKAQEVVKAEAAREAEVSSRAKAQAEAQLAAEQRAGADAQQAATEIVAVFLDTMARAGNPGIRPVYVTRSIPFLAFRRRLAGVTGWVVREPGEPVMARVGYERMVQGHAVLLDGRVIRTYSPSTDKRIHLDLTELVDADQIQASDLAATLERFGLRP